MKGNPSRFLSRVALIALLAVGASCTPAHVQHRRDRIAVKLAGGCRTAEECRNLRAEARQALAECEKTAGSCERDVRALRSAEEMFYDADRRKTLAEQQAQQQVLARARGEQAQRLTAVAGQRAAEQRERTQAEEAAKYRDEQRRYLRARLIVAMRMLAPATDGKAAADALVALLDTDASAATREWEYLSEIAVTFAALPGWKGDWQSSLKPSVERMNATRLECVNLVGTSYSWKYRYLGLDAKYRSTCGQKQYAEGLRWVPLRDDAPEIKRLRNQQLGLGESVTACEEGKAPHAVVTKATPFACPKFTAPSPVASSSAP
jgi:hypothetical protein